MKDLKTTIDVVQSIVPAAHTASTNGTGIDLQNFNSAVVVFDPGTITDGTHTPKVQESADNTTFTDVAAGDIGGTLAALASSTIQRGGYIGNKRYIRAVVTVASATTGGVYGSSVVRGHPDLAPVA